jgi:hypothetical protein
MVFLPTSSPFQEVGTLDIVELKGIFSQTRNPRSCTQSKAAKRIWKETTAIPITDMHHRQALYETKQTRVLVKV